MIEVRRSGEFDVVGAGTDRSRTLITGGPAVVLVRSQLGVNIGMAARAMANFGLSDLRLVAPRGDITRDDARAAAAGALHVLEGAKIYASLREAVADLHFVWATTARERGQGKRVAPPGTAMAETAARMRTDERHGVVFGPERTGLENDEVTVADAIITFPVNSAYGSLNLAQAVLLTGYEWFRAAEGEALPFATFDRSPPAAREDVLSFFEYLEAQLEKAEFFRPEGKQPVMRRNLRNIFHRIGLTEQDVRTLRGAIVRLVEGPREAPRTRRSPRRPAGGSEAPPSGGDLP